MLVRPDAPIYESDLIRSIAQRNQRAALHLIRGIDEYTGENPPSLTYVHEEYGENFLAFALSSAMPVVVNALLDTMLFDDSDILFSVNKMGKTLITQATELKYDDIVIRLLNLTLARLKQAADADPQLWFKQDSTGNTPLHYAIINGQTNLIEKFVSLIRSQENSIQLVNHANRKGDTPLHFILRNDLAVVYVDQLLALGADFAAVNNAMQTPFGVLTRYDAPRQIHWVQQLSQNNRKKIITLYHDYLVRHQDEAVYPEVNAIRKAFLTLSGVNGSLQDLIAAHFEVDNHLRVNQAILNQLDDLKYAEKLPKYREKLIADNIFFSKTEVRPNAEELVTQDRNTLTKLIADIETYLVDVRSRKPKEIYKAISIVVPVLVWLIYGGILAWLLYETYASPRQECEEKLSGETRCHSKDIYLGSTLFFGSFVCFFNLLVSIILPICLWEKRVALTISPSEWQDLLTSLENEVIGKLRVLRDNDTPTDSLHDLEIAVANLNGRKSQEQTITAHSSIRELLAKIREDLSRSQKPFSTSLFAPKEPDLREVIVLDDAWNDSEDSETVYSSDDDARPLLRLTR